MIYKEILDFPGYRVGDDGSVWSCWKMNGHQSATLSNNWKLLKPHPQISGHLSVCLYRDGRPHHKLVHRLVLEAFVGPCPIGMECRHYPDSSPINNHKSNLSWATPEVNQSDKIKDGTDNRGSKHGLAKLNEQAIALIFEEWNSGRYTRRMIAQNNGVHVATINKILRGELWSHLTGLRS